MQSLTFDTGALIALQDHPLGRGIAEVVRTANAEGTVILVSANVIAEWWRGGARGQRRVLELLGRSLRIQDVTDRVARLAGEALEWYGREKKPQKPRERIARLTFDATVMATACLCGRKSHEEAATIYTGDADMDDLAEFESFPNVVLLRPP